MPHSKNPKRARVRHGYVPTIFENDPEQNNEIRQARSGEVLAQCALTVVAALALVAVVLLLSVR